MCLGNNSQVTVIVNLQRTDWNYTNNKFTSVHFSTRVEEDAFFFPHDVKPPSEKTKINLFEILSKHGVDNYINSISNSHFIDKLNYQFIYDLDTFKQYYNKYHILRGL